MSNGSGETGRQLEEPNKGRKLGGDEFARAIAKIAVAQVCESEGFQSFQESVLETFSDVVVRYIWNIGRTAHYHANLAGRAECNVFDVIQGLEDLGSVQGFTGASDVAHCLRSSGIVRDIVQYVSEAELIPFAYPVPQFPVVKERILTPSFQQIGEDPPSEHIPAWLPAFPDPHAYSESPPWSGRGMEPNAAKFDQERKHGKGERCLLNFQQQLVSNNFVKSALVDQTDVKEKKVAMADNPYLATPLQFGDKQVISVAPTPKVSNDIASANPVVESFVEDKSISVLETFAPGIEAMKTTECTSVEEQTKLLSNGRPTVRFKIGIRNNFLGRFVDFSAQEGEEQKTLPWFAMEDEKDDRKRRAEKILRKCLENADELVQL